MTTVLAVRLWSHALRHKNLPPGQKDLRQPQGKLEEKTEAGKPREKADG